MQKLLDELTTNFPLYKATVDSIYAKDADRWSHVFNTENQESQMPFYQGIFSVIRHFLNEDVRNFDVVPEQLFIQIPMEELGRTETVRRENLNHLHEIVAAALSYATGDQLRRNSECSGMDHVKEGEFYYTKSEDNNGDCWLILPSTQSATGLRPKLLRDRYTCRTSEAINMFNQSSKMTIRIAANPADCSAHTQTANKKSLYKCFNNVRLYSRSEFFFEKQYQSAYIIGYPDTWCTNGTIYGNEYVGSPVQFSRNLAQTQVKSDILVLIGDRKYKNFERRINNALADGRIKKVIYIGTDIPFEGYDKDIRNVRYSFSFRELFTYFYGKYPDIHFHKYDFPWLFEKLSQLRELLVQTGVYEEYHQSIMTIIAYRFLGVDFDRIPTNFAADIKERLLYDFGVSEEALDSWLEELSYDKSKTPKIVAKDQIFRGSIGFVVSNRKKTISDYLKQHVNKHNQKVLIDIRGDWRGYLEVIESLLSQSIFGEYHICTYTDLPRIQAFFEKEPKIYNNPYRVNMLGGQSFQILSGHIQLSDYFDPNMLDNLLQQDNNGSAKRIAYTLHGTSTNATVMGDVIYEDNTKPLSELLEEREDIFPTELTYYRQPENYEQLMALYFDLPQGEDVAYFSDLWKARLRSYCNSMYDGNIKEMAKKEFPFMRNQFKSIHYIEMENSIKFPDSMIKLAMQMCRKGIISEKEQNMLIAAHNLNKQNIPLGRTLKEALYAYRLKGRKASILVKIEANALSRGLSIDAESIANSALITDKFTDITKEK